MKTKYLLSFVVALSYVFSFVSASNYPAEYVNAYSYAYKQGITTTLSIDKANIYGGLTRIAMAKMISNFAINVLGLKPDTSKDCSFLDITDKLNSDYDHGVTKACQLGLMGIGSDGKVSKYFNPSGTVTRGQWATAFSRALSKYNGDTVIESSPYYKPHLDYLYSKGIVKNVENPSPKSEEKRGNVMIMMYRVDSSNENVDEKSDIVTVNYEIGYTKLEPKQTYYNTFYGLQIEHNGDYPYLINVASGDDGLYIAFYSFVPQKYGDYELMMDYINEYKNNAKKFNETGLLMHIESWSLTKKGLEDYESVIERLKDSGYSINQTSKGCIVYQEPGMSIQESSYEYTGKGEEKESYRNVLWNVVGDYKLIQK